MIKKLCIEHKQSIQLIIRWLIYNYYFLGEITHQYGHFAFSNFKQHYYKYQ